MNTSTFLQELAVSEILMLVVGGIMILVLVPLLIGLLRVPFSSPQLDDTLLPTVTVLVSARNEEKDLPRCIDALLNLDYPAGKLDIILVDDRSTDQTSEIIRRIAAKHPHVRALHTVDFDVTLVGKARGLAVGMRHATGEWVAMTDADAQPNPKWLRHLLNNVPDNVGMVGGSLIVEPVGLVGKIERCVFTYVQMFNVGLHGLGGYISCIGSNLVMRRSIYENAGGFENVPDGPQDDLILHNMTVQAGWKVIQFMDQPTSVRLMPVPGYAYLVSQQRRWLGGGYNIEGYLLPLLALFWYGFLLGFFLLFGWIFSMKVWLLLFCFRTVLELTNMGIQRWRFKESAMFRHYWSFMFYGAMIKMILPVSLLIDSKIRWRGKGYVITYH
jgi:cellulose synthase/poly-beta-1,6-N-acetylglucosamine synthase-like glycosyltransferase